MKKIIIPGYKTIEGIEPEVFADNFNFKIDLHIHSEASYDVLDQQLAPENMVAKAESLGLLPVLTDHNTYEGINRAKCHFVSQNKEANLIPGVEFSLKPSKMKALGEDFKEDIHTLHIGVLNLSQKQFENLDIAAKSGDLDGFVEYCRSQRLPYVYHHIFWWEAGETLNWGVIPRIARKYFDVVELNAKRTSEQNDLTLKLAEELRLGIVASSDTHIGEVGKAFTFGNGADFNEFWWDCVVPARAYIAREDLTTASFISEVHKFIKDFFSADSDYLRKKGILLDTGVGFFQLLMKQLAYGKLRERRFLCKSLEMILQSTAASRLGYALIDRIHLKPQKASALKINDFVLQMCKELA